MGTGVMRSDAKKFIAHNAEINDNQNDKNSVKTPLFPQKMTNNNISLHKWGILLMMNDEAAASELASC